MKRIWKLQYEFAYAKINLHDISTRRDLYLFALLRFDIVKTAYVLFPFLDSTKLKIVWTKITTFFKRRVSIIL